jgi:hypothetical protein
METETGSTGSHSVENWLWKGLWTCRKTILWLSNILYMSEVVIGRSCAEFVCEASVFQSVVRGTSLGIPREIVE